MKYKEWEHLEISKDKDNPLVDVYHLEDALFYIEPAFYTQFVNLKNLHPERIDEVVKLMNETVLKEKRVVFCHDFENPYVQKEGFIYLEIEDITNPLKIFVEDKSRGSDYGD